jgi:hypothetical protein
MPWGHLHDISRKHILVLNIPTPVRQDPDTGLIAVALRLAFRGSTKCFGKGNRGVSMQVLYNIYRYMAFVLIGVLIRFCLVLGV